MTTNENKIQIACIGSRDIPPSKVKILESLGEEIVSRGWYIRTGNAKGADQAYARGGNKKDPSYVKLFLPWASYEIAAIHTLNKVYPNSCWDDKHLRVLTSIAREHHPAWKNLSYGVKSLMIRNAAIIQSSTLVVAYLNHNKKGGGGTGHGWRIAETLNIPRLDASTLNETEILNSLEVIKKG